jgi:hypothetical protein
VRRTSTTWAGIRPTYAGCVVTEGRLQYLMRRCRLKRLKEEVADERLEIGQAEPEMESSKLVRRRRLPLGCMWLWHDKQLRRRCGLVIGLHVRRSERGRVRGQRRRLLLPGRKRRGPIARL